jgi:hypothetical protein
MEICAEGLITLPGGHGHAVYHWPGCSKLQNLRYPNCVIKLNDYVISFSYSIQNYVILVTNVSLVLTKHLMLLLSLTRALGIT